MKLEDIFNKTLELINLQMDSTFRMIEKISENDSRKIEQLQKISNLKDEVKKMNKTLRNIFIALLFINFFLFSITIFLSP